MASCPREEELLGPLAAYLQKHRTAGSGAVAGSGSCSSTPGSDPRFDLVRSVGEECQTEPELRALIEKKPNFVLYDGFEPSGRMHIAQGVFKAINVNKCTQAGGTFIFWVADWFALMNDKMGGDLDKIKTVGKYLIEVWKAGGMDMSRVKFLWSSDEISANAKEYWGQALDIARLSTLGRIKRCCQIMGRAEDALTAAQIMYPIMQCTDIFFLKADICQLGVDQRKVNMLAREYCDSAGRKTKPIVLSHHMLFGLKAGQAKMSKSDPDSAIFMEDSAADVERKIRNAYCPLKPEAAAQRSDDDEMHLVKDTLANPCLDYIRYILFSNPGFTFTVEGTRYTDFDDLKGAFVSGKISETALKDKLIEEVNAYLEPVRKHFQSDSVAKELLAKVSQWKKETLTAPSGVTRLKAVEPKSAPVFAVFAPQPSAAVQLDAVLALLQRLRRAPADAQPILWLEDWSSRALGRLGGSEQCIKGFYEILLFGLRTLAPDLMQRVRICWQGEMILSDPSAYWICVINAGRRTSLDAIRNGLPAGENLEQASQVVTSLMHIGDVFALVGASHVTLCCDEYHKNLHELAAQHCKTCEFSLPDVEFVAAKSLRLMPEGEGIEADMNVLLTDKDIEVNKKVKKAFCEPGNTSFCPPIEWIAELLPLQKEFVVSRKPDNGGDKSYTSANELRQDFASGSLHPGDLKPAVSRMLNAALESARAGLRDQDVPKKAAKDLENWAKSQAKAPKKK
eukprot:CAMPEP_0197897592 /NCGR_PEP_ID=MMETSP1439-20131203/42268_1 /TAXON_ID=66791 /ORGANISM="Gonyaulax spinifera, Strain CCMP409" /LENGTH=735 /DNA_ID=CAMNT_0043518231 /DNA_START=47 /DNA_END=2254 /DNA_ORIENTATION=+